MVSRRIPLYVWIVVFTLTAEASTEEAARKVIASRCWACHSQTSLGGLRLDSRAAMLRGGKSGAALIPGDVSGSRLYDAVARTKPGVKPMPPGKELEPDEIASIARWIKDGAPWADQTGHWSFLPLRVLQPGDSIDSLIHAAQVKRGLAVNAPAAKRTLIRRMYVDLIGLPPTETEFAEAFGDETSAWVSNLVSKLLASPRFGEKWARQWLDVARYGEDDFTGTKVVPYENAWRYRDWVVDAFNRDLPYDRFLMAQLAGDLMNDRTLLPATGLLGLGPWYYSIAQPAQSRADERNDRVDVVTRGMLGVTVACARCHDHKYDPFTAKDYYALAGVFASTAYKEYPLVSDADADAWKAEKKKVDEAEKALNKFLDDQADLLADTYSQQIPAYMLATVDPSRAYDLQPKVLQRWKAYLEKPEEQHPFLRGWFGGQRSAEEANRFQQLLLSIRTEKKLLDEENRKSTEIATKNEPKVVQTIVLPGGYRSEEDFNPGAYIPAKSLERNRFVAWNRTFNDKSGPLKFDRELTAELLKAESKPEYQRLRSHFDALKKALPAQYPYLHGAAEFEASDLMLNVRGNPMALGDVVPRRFPLALSEGKAISFDQGSGRLQMAGTVAHHPLAARVAVNRIWMALFGEGLVRTPSNFGAMGDRPVLPELLDYLAARFVEQGYAVKPLIREIVLSAAYQRSSGSNAENEKIDPDNRYFSRQNRRRLQAEPLRDAMLAVSGEIDYSVGGESKPLDASFRRRTLYAKMSRFQQDETLSLFDLPSASVTCEQRTVTNVPLQMLFYLNSDVVAERAAALAKRIEAPDPRVAVERAYRLLFYREPSAFERKLGEEFLSAEAGKEACKQYAKVLLSSNEFAYVD